MRHKLAIQSRDSTLDGRGQRAQTYSAMVTVRGAIEDLSGRELEQAHKLYAAATAKLTIRYYPGLTTTHRIQHTTDEDGTRNFNIGAILNWQGRDVWLVLLCSEEK